MQFDWIIDDTRWERSPTDIHPEVNGRPVETARFTREEIIQGCGAKDLDDWLGALRQWVADQDPAYEIVEYGPPGTLSLNRRAPRR